MPEFTIEFEVWCGTCGQGLCRLTSVSGDVVTIDACPGCMEIKDDEISALEDEVATLNNTVEELGDEINHLNNEIQQLSTLND